MCPLCRIEYHRPYLHPPPSATTENHESRSIKFGRQSVGTGYCTGGWSDGERKGSSPQAREMCVNTLECWFLR